MSKAPGYVPTIRELGWFAQAPGRHRPTLYKKLRRAVRMWWAKRIAKPIRELANALRDLRAGSARTARKRPVLKPEPVSLTAPTVASRHLTRRHRAPGSRQPSPARLSRRLQEALEFTEALRRQGKPLVTRHAANGRGERSLKVWLIA